MVVSHTWAARVRMIAPHIIAWWLAFCSALKHQEGNQGVMATWGKKSMWEKVTDVSLDEYHSEKCRGDGNSCSMSVEHVMVRSRVEGFWYIQKNGTWGAAESLTQWHQYSLFNCSMSSRRRGPPLIPLVQATPLSSFFMNVTISIIIIFMSLHETREKATILLSLVLSWVQKPKTHSSSSDLQQEQSVYYCVSSQQRLKTRRSIIILFSIIIIMSISPSSHHIICPQLPFVTCDIHLWQPLLMTIWSGVVIWSDLLISSERIEGSVILWTNQLWSVRSKNRPSAAITFSCFLSWKQLVSPQINVRCSSATLSPQDK